MTTVRQPLTNVLIRENKHGSEKAMSCFGVTQSVRGSIEVQIAEKVHKSFQHPCEVLMLSDRGTCWHRFKTEQQ